MYHEDVNGRFDGHSEWNIENVSIMKTTKYKPQRSRLIGWRRNSLILKMTRKWDDDTIQIKASTDYEETVEEYTVNYRDFCYAIAKGCTKAIKQYGLYGYRYSTEDDYIKLYQLLFIKAYALENMEARELTVFNEGLDGCKSNFEKEMELLLFDM